MATFKKSVDARILEHLQKGRPLTVAQASYRFRVRPHTVRARVAELRTYGHPIATYQRASGVHVYQYGDTPVSGAERTF